MVFQGLGDLLGRGPPPDLAELAVEPVAPAGELERMRRHAAGVTEVVESLKPKAEALRKSTRELAGARLKGAGM
jgi:hypothetical protein